MKKVNKNFMYNMVYQILLYIIPFIVTPYISRVLGAENIGIYSYTYSIVTYFMLLTLLGINNYGTRNIARNHKNREKLSFTFSSIYYLQIIMGIIMLVIYNISIIFMDKAYTMLFLINNLFIISAILDINWLFFGLEEFKITTVRNGIIKIVSVILIFLLVKRKEDLWKYLLIMSGSLVISQLYLFLFIKRYVDFKKVKMKDITKHIKSVFVLFIPVIAYSVYRIMDKTMIRWNR